MDDFEEYLNQLYFNILRETQSMLIPEKVAPVSLLDLAPEKRLAALAAFQQTYRAQQGTPEAMGQRANKGLFNAEGTFTYLAEHLGDLVNRMTQTHCDRTDFGFEAVQPKVSRAILIVKDGYGFDRDIDESLVNNFKHHNGDGTQEEWLAQFDAARARYASAHKALVVYNDVQFIARQIAIDHGRRNTIGLLNGLNELADKLSDREAWRYKASLVTIDSAGKLIPKTR